MPFYYGRVTITSFKSRGGCWARHTEESQTMTRTPLRNPSSPRRRHRLAAATLTGVLSVVGFAIVGETGVGAAPRTTSTVIATEAGQAVAALERWQQTSHPIDYIRFVQHRDQAATLTERDIELADGALRDAWANVSVAKQHTLLSAVSQLGVPYDYLASEPGVGFDCSGLTIWAFGSAGVEIPRVSRDQIDEAVETDRDDAEAGDLVYYPGHVSLYLGADTMVHSPNSGNHVEITDLPDKSLRFGDAEATQLAAASAPDSLVDRTLAVTE